MVTWGNSLVAVGGKGGKGARREWRPYCRTLACLTRRRKHSHPKLWGHWSTLQKRKSKQETWGECHVWVNLTHSVFHLMSLAILSLPFEGECLTLSAFLVVSSYCPPDSQTPKMPTNFTVVPVEDVKGSNSDAAAPGDGKPASLGKIFGEGEKDDISQGPGSGMCVEVWKQTLLFDFKQAHKLWKVHYQYPSYSVWGHKGPGTRPSMHWETHRCFKSL